MTAGSCLLTWPIRILEKTRSETRLSKALPWGSGLGVATHPVAQLKQEDNPVQLSLQSTHRPRPSRTHTFHTIYDAKGDQTRAVAAYKRAEANGDPYPSRRPEDMYPLGKSFSIKNIWFSTSRRHRPQTVSVS
jgi:hypothetical protein